MSGAVVIRQPGAASVTTRSRGATPVTKSTAGLEWTPAFGFDDLSAVALDKAPAAGSLASAAARIRGTRPLPDQTNGDREQMQIGARASADRIVIAQLTRAVRKDGAGTWRPSTGWMTQTRTLVATSPVKSSGKRRVHLGQLGAADAAAGPTSAPTWADRCQETGHEVEAFLPPSARRRLAALVPNPEYYVGSLLLWGDGAQTIELIKTCRASAVVLKGRRVDSPAADWILEEWIYPLTTGTRAIASQTRKAIS
jgi:hypothetical protein